MENVIIRQIPTGPFQVFTYLVACPGTREAVLIDPAGEEERLAAMIAGEGLKVNSIEKKLLPLPDDTKIWPGHDYGETSFSTMGREKEENVYITDFLS